MRDIRCPSCHRLQFKAILTAGSVVETLCRCKTRVRADCEETLVIAVAASPSATFNGVSYAAFGIGVR